LRMEEKRYLHQKDALILAMKTLKESVKSFREQNLDTLTDTTQNFFNELVPENSYTIHFDEHFNPELDCKGMPVTTEQLSSGTFDQLYFAYRLALSELLMPDLSFPFIMDDALVHCDEARTRQIFEVLQRLKNSRQILVFSSRKDYAPFCDYVISLE
ncbi:MAG: hypothetical protein WAN36_14805, partial [Calditrichia bacterium]